MYARFYKKNLKMTSTPNGCDTDNGDDIYLFDPSILKDIDFSDCMANYHPQISHHHPGDGLIVRPLCLADYHRGYVHLLSQLTKVGELSRDKFNAHFHCMKNSSGSYYIAVIEESLTGQVVASATLLIEYKFIHGASLVGRIEDVVVSNEQRGRQLGKLLVDLLTLLSKKLGCYKVSLICKDPLKPFYKKLGYNTEDGQNYLVQRFSD